MAKFAITIFFGDAEHDFNLNAGTLDQLYELEDLRGCGAIVVWKRLRDLTFSIKDVREVLRLGLVGGGMVPHEAHKLIVRYFDKEAPVANVETAFECLSMALFGPDGPPPAGTPGVPD